MPRSRPTRWALELSDIFITLKPRTEWKRAKTQDELVSAMAQATKVLPGMRAVYTQPIEMRINEMVAGIRADLGIKLYGEDLETLKAKADEIEKVVKSIPGAADTTTEQVTGLPVLRIRVDNEALSRYGVPAQQVLDAIKAVGGIDVGEIIEPGRRFPLVVRLPMAYREDPQALEQILDPHRVRATAAAHPARADRGKHRTIDHPTRLGRASHHRADERAGAATSAHSSKKPRSESAARLHLPVGYTIEWGGQFEHLERAEQRLYVVVPLALALILSLLYLTFRSLRDAVMIFSGVLFARVGGILGLYVMGLPFTISAGVGFVALAGASILEGLILVSSIRDRMARGVPKREAIEQARLARLRPVLMTGTVAALGFVPMMLATGIGAEVQRPLATVIVFGMACDTFLTMLALPVLYLLFGKGPLAKAENGQEPIRPPAVPHPLQATSSDRSPPRRTT